MPGKHPTAKATNTALVSRIRDLIHETDGWLRFDRFMQEALYAPGLGYYVSGWQQLGASGDFITAPELGNVFGQCLADQCVEVLALVGGGDVLEFGAGSGVLAATILRRMDEQDALPRSLLHFGTQPVIACSTNRNVG